ncbi:hypothetical protein CLV98_1325 [Dyadobacter jejuensis]|uniref:Uncharacterized protein n=1 Tax=Dyadobacter jejuensis TaxID=1082580 RepID=A0A316ARM3_9BACT|nr:hypothetical protein [Dyadobacter jejuensis]PWJ52747.1 hypothetical protein CLV98_1325 [Dyadobacter jejuensis]
MKKIILFILLLANGLSYAQVKVGSNPTSITPNVNLEVEATNGSKVVIKQDNGSMGIGTTTTPAQLNVEGNIKIVDGNQGTGKVLTSDATGLGSWQTPYSAPVGGGIGQIQAVQQTSDIIFTTQSLTDLPGISIPLLAGKTYLFEFQCLVELYFLSAAIKYGNNGSDIADLVGGMYLSRRNETTDPYPPYTTGVNQGITLNKSCLVSYTETRLPVSKLTGPTALQGASILVMQGIIKTNTAQNLIIQGTNDQIEPGFVTVIDNNSAKPVKFSNGTLSVTQLD